MGAEALVEKHYNVTSGFIDTIMSWVTSCINLWHAVSAEFVGGV